MALGTDGRGAGTQTEAESKACMARHLCRTLRMSHAAPDMSTQKDASSALALGDC